MYATTRKVKEKFKLSGKIRVFNNGFNLLNNNLFIFRCYCRSKYSPVTSYFRDFCNKL